ncbi:hypothetical protein TGAMA5MH_06451 [Trichoderma gamsii]|uniref:Uncharacterized protein n=1 Tax=Trichoderma gamsii TaxID=398673 RepID=A0A2K0T814_9HYPO|nr:hypothetical protein TGAMA5MH_06451 [Trichoderma gamsii]
MGHRAASSSSALPRFLLSLSASSTSSQQQLHGPPLSPDSACQSTGQDSIELVAVRHQSWSNSNNLLTAAAASAAAPRVVRHKRASLSLPVVATPSSSSTSVPEEEKIASLERDKHLGLGLGRRSRSSTTSLACSTVSATDSLGKGITPAERQNKANQVWRGYW